jgi:hypothetical protein
VADRDPISEFIRGLPARSDIIHPEWSPEPLVSSADFPAIIESLHEAASLERPAACRQPATGDDIRQLLSRYAGALGQAIWLDVAEWSRQNSEVFGLSDTSSATLIPLNASAIDSEMHRLWLQSIDFPWSRLRSLADKLVKHFVGRHCSASGIDEVLRQIGNKEGLCLAGYQGALDKCGRYWFRRSIEEHQATGFHTALSANFKMLGAVPHLLISAWRSSDAGRAQAALAIVEDDAMVQNLLRQAQDVAHYLATCHMEFLHASDNLLWDSAGSRAAHGLAIDLTSTPPVICIGLPAVMEAAKRLETARRNAGFPELRLGCPALKVRSGEGGSLVSAVRGWCASIFKKFALPLLYEEKLRSLESKE